MVKWDFSNFLLEIMTLERFDIITTSSLLNQMFEKENNKFEREENKKFQSLILLVKRERFGFVRLGLSSPGDVRLG